MKIPKLKFQKITLLFIGLITFTILISSCEKTAHSDKDGITQEDINTMKKKHLITLNEAVKMYKKYDKDRVKILKDTLKKKYKDAKFKDTRMVWFDIQDIKAYLAYLENNTSDAEGLAFYFTVNNEGSKQKNQQSFFIAPTVKKVVEGETIQSGYTYYKGERVFLSEKYKNYGDSTQTKNVQKASFLNFVQNEDGYLFNSGRENPPFPDN
jgi:hypothetical protein